MPWHGQQRSASAQGWLPAGTALRCAGKGSIIAALVLGLLIPYNGLAGADTQAPSAHAAPCSAAQRSSEDSALERQPVEVNMSHRGPAALT